MELTQQELRSTLDMVLGDLIASRLKSVDAPCSSEAHLTSAIVALYRLLAGAYQCSSAEALEILEEAIEEMSLLGVGRSA